MARVHTLYGEIPQSVWVKAQQVKLLICDVDGRIFRWSNISG